MRNLANYISISRIALAVMMVFSKPLSLTFFAIFILCGITDILDGYVARKYGLASDFGAKLDSFADVVFFLSFLIVLLPVLCYDNLIFFWIVAIALIKVISIVLGFVRFGRLALIHTYLNKITGACIILLPFILLLSLQNPVIILICLLATFAAVEELMIVVFSAELALDCSSIFNLHSL